MIKLKKKLLIFDLDGVLIDSRENMRLSWLSVQKKHILNHIKFENYFKQIGRPFFDILKNIGVKKNFKKINHTYKKASIANIDKIKYFKNVIKTLKYFKSKKFTLCIVTSKDLIRTKKILNKNIKLFTFIECNNNNLKGKPHPQSILKIIDKTPYNKSNAIYIGDTNVDYLTAKNSKIDFMFIKNGYGFNYNYKYKSKNVVDLKKILRFG